MADTSSAVLHIADRDTWETAQRAGIYAIPAGAAFIHCCYEHQLRGVLSRFYASLDRSKLLLLTLAPDGLDLRVEAAEDGTGDYPHVYEPVPVDKVLSADPLG